ncbi:hypothetical protein Landi51_07501 [Colletotrichum acutatum]
MPATLGMRSEERKFGYWTRQGTLRLKGANMGREQGGWLDNCLSGDSAVGTVHERLAKEGQATSATDNRNRGPEDRRARVFPLRKPYKPTHQPKRGGTLGLPGDLTGYVCAIIGPGPGLVGSPTRGQAQ